MITNRLKRSRLQILYGLLTAMTVLGLVAAFALSWFWNIQKIERQFSAESQVISQYVREKMAQNETLLVGLSTYFKGKRDVDPLAVRNYANIMSRRFPHIYMFQAAQFVKYENWQHYVDLMNDQNSNAELLRFVDGEGVVQRKIAEGDQALPVIMIEPSVEVSRLGLDLHTIGFINNHIPQDASERIVFTEPFQMLDEDKVMVMMQIVAKDGLPQFLSLLVVKVSDLLPPAMAELRGVEARLGVLTGGRRFVLATNEVADHQGSVLESLFPDFLLSTQIDFSDYRLELDFSRQPDWRDIEWSWLVLLAIAVILLPGLYRFLFSMHSRFEANEELKRQQLYHQANYDSLTALPNRYHFEDYALRLLSTAQRSQQDVALFYLDLNGFKAVNDNLGHEAGDLVLRRVGSALSKTLRRGDMAARIGGDEFVVIVDPVDDMESLMTVMEKLRDLVFDVNSAEFSPYEVSASLGFAYTRVHGHQLSTLMRIADGAMYEEKKHHHRQRDEAQEAGRLTQGGVE